MKRPTIENIIILQFDEYYGEQPDGADNVRSTLESVGRAMGWEVRDAREGNVTYDAWDPNWDNFSDLVDDKASTGEIWTQDAPDYVYEMAIFGSGAGEITERLSKEYPRPETEPPSRKAPEMER